MGGWHRCGQLRPAEKPSLTAPSPSAGPPGPEPARGQQREQEVRQQAQQEGAEGQPDAGHPPRHVLCGVAPLLRHQCHAGKHVRGFFMLGFQKVFTLNPAGLAGKPLGQKMQFPRQATARKNLLTGL